MWDWDYHLKLKSKRQQTEKNTFGIERAMVPIVPYKKWKSRFMDITALKVHRNRQAMTSAKLVFNWLTSTKIEN